MQNDFQHFFDMASLQGAGMLPQSELSRIYPQSYLDFFVILLYFWSIGAFIYVYKLLHWLKKYNIDE